MGIDNEIILEANNYFSGKPLGYISNRVYSYSINPIIYTELLKLRDTIVACAIVSYITLAERVFIGNDYDFQLFDNLTHAITWINSVVKLSRNI